MPDEIHEWVEVSHGAEMSTLYPPKSVSFEMLLLTMLTSCSIIKKSKYETQEHELDLRRQRIDIFPWLAPGIFKYFSRIMWLVKYKCELLFPLV